MSSTLTRADLSDKIHLKIGLPYTESAEVVDNVIDEFIASISNEGELKLTGLGTFKVRHKKQRIGRNPKTKKEAVISARDVTVFSPSKTLVKKING